MRSVWVLPVAVFYTSWPGLRVLSLLRVASASKALGTTGVFGIDIHPSDVKKIAVCSTRIFIPDFAGGATGQIPAENGQVHGS